MLQLAMAARLRRGCHVRPPSVVRSGTSVRERITSRVCESLITRPEKGPVSPRPAQHGPQVSPWSRLTAMQLVKTA